MNRFFLPLSAFQGDEIHFPPDISAQIARVLRLSETENVLVLDDLGSAFEVQLETISARETRGRIIRRFAASNEPRTRLILQVCLTQREKFEWILQKGTELGVSAFMPVLTSRTLVQRVEEVSAKMERWQKILKEAAEQSGRGRIPQMLHPMRIRNAIISNASSLEIVLNVDESHRSLKQILDENPGFSEIRMLIGPEGGFSDDEIQVAKTAGYTSASLGPRVLRMETAAIAAVVIVMAQRGEMERSSD